MADAIALCRFWRNLISSNGDISAVVGFARWKRPTVAPLLWAGTAPVPFVRTIRRLPASGKVAIWKSRTSARLLSAIKRTGAEVVEVEDGFIRSSGLGAECVPPLSVLVDRLGIYLDPSRPSELEELLQNGTFSSDLLKRARQLRERIVESGLTKYGTGAEEAPHRRAGARTIFVPGQVEDDRSVISGGGEVQSNLELLRRVRLSTPDAFIIYKPHPDVEAGHRRGRVSDEEVLAFADEVIRDGSISSIMTIVDEVHVNTSLAGFEGLLRGKKVVTYGVPFYAGWGLTTDRGPVPSRRTAKRNLDELVAASLLLYPRYLDPVTRLPCPAEVLVTRLADVEFGASRGIIISFRRLQGRVNRAIARMWPH
jgi:capsular polysaccharide export protein